MMDFRSPHQEDIFGEQRRLRRSNPAVSLLTNAHTDLPTDDAYTPYCRTARVKLAGLRTATPLQTHVDHAICASPEGIATSFERMRSTLTRPGRVLLWPPGIVSIRSDHRSDRAELWPLHLERAHEVRRPPCARESRRICKRWASSIREKKTLDPR